MTTVILVAFVRKGENYVFISYNEILKVYRKSFFHHTPTKSRFFLPLVFTKMLLFAKVMRKNSILTSGRNEECRKSQA